MQPAQASPSSHSAHTHTAPWPPGAPPCTGASLPVASAAPGPARCTCRRRRPPAEHSMHESVRVRQAQADGPLSPTLLLSSPAQPTAGLPQGLRNHPSAHKDGRPAEAAWACNPDDMWRQASLAHSPLFPHRLSRTQNFHPAPYGTQTFTQRCLGLKLSHRAVQDSDFRTAPFETQTSTLRFPGFRLPHRAV